MVVGMLQNCAIPLHPPQLRGSYPLRRGHFHQEYRSLFNFTDIINSNGPIRIRHGERADLEQVVRPNAMPLPTPDLAWTRQGNIRIR